MLSEVEAQNMKLILTRYLHEPCEGFEPSQGCWDYALRIESMKFKKVNLIGEEFSAVGFGCWGISGGDVWNKTIDRNSIEAIHAALDLDVNFFDVAPVYGLGHAEQILGQALKGKRHDVIIASKCGLVWDDRKRVTNNLTTKSIHWEIDQSLRRLNTDYVDIYQIHWPDPNTTIEETMEALERIRESGKIRYIGVSNFSLELTQHALKVAAVVSHQGLYNMLERNPTSYHSIPLTYQVENEILPLCQEKGMAFFPYSPIFQGLLTDSFQVEENFDENDVRSANPKLNGELFKQYFEIVQKVKEYAHTIDKPLSQVAINWLIKHDAVTSVICGAQNVQHVQENVGSVEWELTDDMLECIEKILEPYVDIF